jgi:ABC-type multidrug transport system fused ATPase/permease subunit
MIRRIGEARNGEQKSLWSVSVYWILLNQLAQLSPLIALLVIFSLYVGFLGLPLTAPVAFTTLTLIMTMRRNLMMIASMSNTAIGAAISAERLDKYFKGTTPLTTYPIGPLRMQNARFRRNKTASFVLQDVSIDFVEGGLNAVTGASGSGKTTLLLAILGETILERGSVTRPDDVAFASQTPWLQSDTIRNNILFHAPFEEARYSAVIEACCLNVDLSELPNGDKTEVGENGTALSGGQRSRVALARTLYSKAPVLLLDDIFSALDSKTAAHVWRFCFCSDMLKGRTVVLVTQMPWMSAQADFAITLENGVVKAAEQNIGAVRTPVIWQKEEETLDENDAEDEDNEDDSGTDTPAEETESDEESVKADDIEREMQQSQGAARWTFFSYMLWFGGRPYAIFCLFTTILANAALIGTSYWLSVWVNAYSAEEAVNIAFYLGIYAVFAVGACVIEGFSNLTYANGAWHAARKLHGQFLRAVMGASLSWWKNVPVGRVVNRFSRDISLVDDQLIKMLQAFLLNFVKIFFSIGAVASILPIFSVPALFVCIIGGICGEMYTRTAVTVKRLVSSSQSPVFSQFGDTLAGLAVIRARSSMPEQFADQLADKLRYMTRAMEANFNCNRWISVRTDFITAAVSLM